MSTLGENLKKIRKAKKLTQKDLAQKSGVKQSVISDLETGNAKSTGSILELANALGVTAEELKKGVVGEIEKANVIPVSPRMAPVLSWVQAGTMTNVESVDMTNGYHFLLNALTAFISRFKALVIVLILLRVTTFLLILKFITAICCLVT